MKFRALVLELHLPQNFCHRHTHTDRQTHFPEIVKSCSGHPKHVNPLKTENRKFARILSSSSTEESKNIIELRVNYIFLYY